MAWKDFAEPVAFSEIEPFPCAVLAHHYPDIPNLGDVTKITETIIKQLGRIDVVVFGSPCQDLSVAGKRRGLLDDEGNFTRSGLFFNALNIVHWARKHGGARFALWENVPGAFSSSKGADFAQVVSLMAGLDSVEAPINGWGSEGCALGDEGLLEWAVLDAQFFGLAQRRKRVFALIDFGDWQSRPPILLERESLRGNTPPGRGKGEEIAGTFKSRTGSGGWSHDVDMAASGYTQVVGSLQARDYKGAGNQFVSEGEVIPVPFDKQRIGEYGGGGVSSTCAARDYKDASDLICYALAGNTIGREPKNGGHHIGFDDTGSCYTLTKTDMRAVAFSAGNSANSRGIGYTEEATPPLRSSASGTNQVPTVAFTQNTLDEVRLIGGGGELAGTLAAQPGMEQTTYLAEPMPVRRLTPVECARLQGFPDTYLDIPFRNKPAADGNKYKALGNSMAVPVMKWIGNRINLALTGEYSGEFNEDFI